MSDTKKRLISSYEYRKNGFDHIKGCKRKDRYGDLAQIKAALVSVSPESVAGEPGVTSGSDKHANRYTFAYKNPQTGEVNFDPETSSSSPYPHQGHHLIPIDFRSLLTDPKVKAIADKVEVNINRGQNIIFLPKRDEYAGYHNLPHHCGSHDKYSKQVLRDADNLKEKLKEYVQDDPCAPEQELPKNMVDQFDKYSNRLWGIVCKAGRKLINAVKILQKGKGKG